MPIKPENKGRYPADWRDISARIRFERAGGRCECTGQCGSTHSPGTRCGASHGDVVRRDLANPARWTYDTSAGLPGAKMKSADKRAAKRGAGKAVKIVLTVAHLDHQPENCADENLLAMCQRCHNCYDSGHRRETRATGKTQRLEDAGQIGLFEM